jgi:hypothetical protein
MTGFPATDAAGSEAEETVRVTIVELGDDVADDHPPLGQDEHQPMDRAAVTGYVCGAVFVLLGIMLAFAEYLFPASVVYPIPTGLNDGPSQPPWPVVVEAAGPPFLFAGLATIAGTRFRAAVLPGVAARLERTTARPVPPT